MDAPVADMEGLSIVLRGHFNPAIITHGWLLSQKLLSVEDFTETRPDLITANVSNFHTPWFSCHVTSDMMQVSTAEPEQMERVRDVTTGILRALPHTPVGVMGINHDFHFKTDGQAEWGSPDVSVGHVRPGSAGRRPPRVSMAMAIGASGVWKP